MTVKFLASMLTKETLVIVKDYKTHRTLFKGSAVNADFEDEVKDWDFCTECVIYI